MNKQKNMNVQKDVQSIIDYSHHFAEQVLIDLKEFYPFAAKIDNNGNLIPVSYADDGTDFPESQKIINVLNNALKEELAQERIRAYGITYNVRVQIGTENKSDAILIDVTHRYANEIPNYYFTYSWNEKDQLIFGKFWKEF